jgi:WhiB family redox-sensing transcriptional regulator
MTTPKKPTETGSARGVSEAMGEILISFKLVDNDARWMDNAKCNADDGISWFPQQGKRHLTAMAKKFCGSCPVRERCLKFALDNEIMYGVWGGKSPAERRRLLYSHKIKVKMGL